MTERSFVSTKKPDVKTQKPVSCSRKSNGCQSRSSPAGQILFLQRTAGNQVVQKLVKSGALHTNIKIGQPGDKYEQKADILESPKSTIVIQRLGNPITEADLPSPTARGISSNEQTLRRFMREVYRRQVALWTAQGATYLHEVPPSELVTLPGNYAIPGQTCIVHKDIQNPATNMIDDARAALRSGSPGGSAANINNVGIRSGYRPAASQFGIWTRWAPEYYRRTQADRQNTTLFPGGEHSDAAAQYLAEYTNQRVFSPGYSPHQHGRTIDVSYEDRTGWAPADTSGTWISRWQSSWFFGWLSRNAILYGFFQNPNINEPWHWEFSPLAASILQLIQWLLDLLEPLIGQRQLWYGDERAGELPE